MFIHFHYFSNNQTIRQPDIALIHCLFTALCNFVLYFLHLAYCMLITISSNKCTLCYEYFLASFRLTVCSTFIYLRYKLHHSQIYLLDRWIWDMMSKLSPFIKPVIKDNHEWALLYSAIMSVYVYHFSKQPYNNCRLFAPMV